MKMRLFAGGGTRALLWPWLRTRSCVVVRLPVPQRSWRWDFYKGKLKNNNNNNKIKQEQMLFKTVWWWQWPKNDRKQYLARFLIWSVEGPRSPGSCGIIDDVSEKRQSPGSQEPHLKRKQAMLSRQEEMFYFWGKIARIVKAKWSLENISEVLLVFLEDFLFVSF